MLNIEYKYLAIIICVLFGLFIDDSYKLEHLSDNPIITGKDIKIQGNLTVTGDSDSQKSINVSNNITCKSLSNTTDLTTTTAKIGKFKIRNKQIGIPGNHSNYSYNYSLNNYLEFPANSSNYDYDYGYDLNFGNDRYIRHVLYDKDAQLTENDYVRNAGFASEYLWTGRSGR